jgi:hypothetical protein
MEKASERRRGIPAHLGFERILRLAPQRARLDQQIAAGLGDGELAASAIASYLKLHEAPPKERADVVTQRRPVHYHHLREWLERDRAQRFCLQQQRKLRRPKTDRSKCLIVELGHASSRLPERKTIAQRIHDSPAPILRRPP